jgi:hypothetical protein
MSDSAESWATCTSDLDTGVVTQIAAKSDIQAPDQIIGSCGSFLNGLEMPRSIGRALHSISLGSIREGIR